MRWRPKGFSSSCIYRIKVWFVEEKFVIWDVVKIAKNLMLFAPRNSMAVLIIILLYVDDFLKRQNGVDMG